MTQTQNKEISKDYQFAPEESTSYYCTNDVGLTTYLIHKGYKISGFMEREDGEPLILINKKEGFEMDRVIVDYQTGLHKDEIMEYLGTVGAYYKVFPIK